MQIFQLINHIVTICINKNTQEFISLHTIITDWYLVINKLYTTVNRNINTHSSNYKYTNEGVGFNYTEDMFMLTGHSRFAIGI